MQRQRVYLMSLAVGLPALVLTYVLVGQDDPVTRYGWPPLIAHLAVSAWVHLRRPHRVVVVERATLLLVTVLMLARMSYHLASKDQEHAWLALGPGTFMFLLLPVVFGYVVLGTSGGPRWSMLVIGVSTTVVLGTVLPQSLAAGQWDVLVSMLRAQTYVIDAAPTGVAVSRWAVEECLVVCPGVDLVDATAPRLAAGTWCASTTRPPDPGRAGARGPAGADKSAI